MAKKKTAVETPVSGARKTIKGYLRELYTKNSEIGNQDVLLKVLAAFPTSKATYKTVLSWKKELRDEGISIPKQRAGAKPKDSSEKPAKKESKKETKKQDTKKKSKK
jgi:hypothetical protein